MAGSADRLRPRHVPRPDIQKPPPAFLALFAARFSFAVLAGFFLLSFFLSMPLLMSVLLLVEGDLLARFLSH